MIKIIMLLIPVLITLIHEVSKLIATRMICKTPSLTDNQTENITKMYRPKKESK